MGIYVARRFALLLPQMLLISVVTFVLIRMLPGDPARLELGPLAPEEGVVALRQRLHLDEPLPVQYYAYLNRLIDGDFGHSWVNGSAVSADLQQRLPATLELITLGSLSVMFFLIPLGVVTAARGGGFIVRFLKRVTFGYGLLAGALPDFWLGLVLILIFFTKLHWVPGPEGRLSILTDPPPNITGLYTVDSLITGNFVAFADAAAHLALPVVTLAFVYGGAVLKMQQSKMAIALRSEYTRYAEGFGLPRRIVLWYAWRNSAPPVIVIAGVVSGYLLGGAVLIETVFNLNGVGQYAVQAVAAADYAPIQAFVLVAAAFTMLVYLAVDLLYLALDPRARMRIAGP